jgi:hypothetical protein
MRIFSQLKSATGPLDRPNRPDLGKWLSVGSVGGGEGVGASGWWTSGASGSIFFFLSFFLGFFTFLSAFAALCSAFSPRVSMHISTGMTLILWGELVKRPGLFLGTNFTGSVGKAG